MYFFLGLCYVGRYYGAWVIISEYAHSRYKNLLFTYLLAIDQIYVILVTLYFKVVPRGECLYIEIGGIVLAAIAVAAAYWLPESPEYLYGMYKFKECK